MFECINAAVTPWHGDIASSVKRRFVERPKGALLITPESLEALFVTRGTAVPRLVEALRYIVVDELHAFIGTERGRRLVPLLEHAEANRNNLLGRLPELVVTHPDGVSDLRLRVENLQPESGSSHRTADRADYI